MTLGERIVSTRDERGLKQIELSRKSGVPQSTLAELESGKTKNISGPHLIALAHTLKVRPRWLMTGLGRKEIDAGDLDIDDREIAFVLAARDQSVKMIAEAKTAYLPRKPARQSRLRKKPMQRGD